MECPFCMEMVKDEALVCKHCGRDLRIPKPLIEENQLLLATVTELQQEVSELKARLRLRQSPVRAWLTRFAVYILPLVLVLLLAHWLLIVKFDVNPIFMRVIAIVVPFLFGFALRWLAHARLPTAVLFGAVAGALAVAGMTTLIALVDQVPILPQNLAEWREVAEYALSIALATVTGAILAALVRRLATQQGRRHGEPSVVAVRMARMIGPVVSKPALRRRAQKIDEFMNSAGAMGAVAASGLGSVYTGLKNLIGS